MPMPRDLPVIDTMIATPLRDKRKMFEFVTRQTKDIESREKYRFPAEFMYHDVPDEAGVGDDPVAITVAEMNRYNIVKGLIAVSGDDDERALQEHPDRFVRALRIDPHQGMQALREMERAKADDNVKAVTVFPAGYLPPVPINDKKLYPIYAKCCELGLPVFACAGVPGPRVPMASQRVELIDEVMYDFPELVFVTRHGCEPWTELMVKLMVKWPNLYYSTSAFSPKYYPRDIVEYANTRGADRIIYAGYFPWGLSLQRIMSDMDEVPFRDHVWPKFLHENAVKVLGISL